MQNDFECSLNSKHFWVHFVICLEILFRYEDRIARKKKKLEAFSTIVEHMLEESSIFANILVTSSALEGQNDFLMGI